MPYRPSTSCGMKELSTGAKVPDPNAPAKVHDDWKCLLIIYDEEGTEDGIPVVSVWKWLMEV